MIHFNCVTNLPRYITIFQGWKIVTCVHVMNCVTNPLRILHEWEIVYTNHNYHKLSQSTLQFFKDGITAYMDFVTNLARVHYNFSKMKNCLHGLCHKSCQSTLQFFKDGKLFTRIVAHIFSSTSKCSHRRIIYYFCKDT